MYARISQNFTGQQGNDPRTVPIVTDATFEQVTAAGFINPYMPAGFSFKPNDILAISYGTNQSGFFKLSISNGIITLNPMYNNISGDTTAGDFAVFSDDEGTIADEGYSPSDATKTKVVMASAAVIANHIACFSDTSGTVNDDSATAINGGNIQAGLSGTAGTVASFPATASKGSLRVAAVANTNDTITTISNVAMGQASVVSIPDPAAATANFVVAPAALVSGNLPAASGTAGLVADSGVVANRVLYTGFATPDVNANIIRVDISVTAAALAAGGVVPLITSSGSKQYKILNIWVNSNGTNFSGGGGDRLLDITDGTTVYSVIPAASLQTLANTAWGVTELPFPASAALNTSTVAGQNLRALYSGGAADYAAGSMVISVLAVRVA